MLLALQKKVIECAQCPRLREHCASVARVKRRAYRDWEYWGKPVPAFGDPDARLLIIGLAPGAHGANRTGRMFTGDSSGDFLYKTLHATGFASQPSSRDREDGLVLRDCYITASIRCAPPDNKPLPEELRRCRPYLERELELLTNLKVVVGLGKIAFDTYLSIVGHRGQFPFAHNQLHRLPGSLPPVISSYHPSQQNTLTGRLTEAMFKAVFRQARKLMDEHSTPDRRP